MTNIATDGSQMLSGDVVIPCTKRPMTHEDAREIINLLKHIEERVHEYL